MLYKVLNDTTVLDVLDSIQYVKYQEVNKLIVICSKDEAMGILSSSSNQIWHLDELKAFPVGEYDTVDLEEIDEEEYEALYQLLESSKDGDNQTQGVEDNYIASTITLDFIKEKKIEQMSSECNSIITNGFDIKLSDKKTYHYTMTLEDQMNISSLEMQVKAGATQVPYHASGELCRMYSSDDILAIVEKGMTFKTYHVTYFNSLKNYINSLESKEAVRDITYGTSIPNEYKSDVLRLLEASA
jgi:hypothetical protein